MVKKPVRAIVDAIDAAAARWSDAAFAERVAARDAVAARTGYAPSAVEYGFDRLFESLRREAIEAVIADELGSLDALDRYVDRVGRPRAQALALGRICVVSSRTTIGVALPAAVFALCAKNEVRVKDREDRLVAAFFETLARELPPLRDALDAQTWHGDGDAEALRGFDAIVAYGSDATLEKIAGTLQYPARLIAFGSKASAGYVGREALRSEAHARAIAAGAARDLLLYESEGCLSLHALFVENDAEVSAERFTEILTEAIRDAAKVFPPAPNVTSAARLAGARDLATFRGARVYSDPPAGYLAVLDPPGDEPPLFLPRSIGVRRVNDSADAAEYLERHGIALEALAVAQPREDLRELAVRAKAARVAPFGTLQAPPLTGFHGGRPRIAEFVRWITDET